MAHLLLTDPPYGVSLNAKNMRLKKHGRGKDWGELENDATPTAEFDIFLKTLFSTIAQHLKDRCAFFVWFANLKFKEFNEALTQAGFLIYRNIIWVKPHFCLAVLPFHWRHEPCLYGWKKGKKADYSQIPNNETTVWEIDYDGKKGNANTTNVHPTMKPVKLFERCIQYGSREGQIITDPFLGSGTTIIAAEKTGRICYGMEISPHYCDVIIKRWEDYTGKKAQKLND